MSLEKEHYGKGKRFKPYVDSSVIALAVGSLLQILGVIIKLRWLGK